MTFTPSILRDPARCVGILTLFFCSINAGAQPAHNHADNAYMSAKAPHVFAGASQGIGFTNQQVVRTQYPKIQIGFTHNVSSEQVVKHCAYYEGVKQTKRVSVRLEDISQHTQM